MKYFCPHKLIANAEAKAYQALDLLGDCAYSLQFSDLDKCQFKMTLDDQNISSIPSMKRCPEGRETNSTTASNLILLDTHTCRQDELTPSLPKSRSFYSAKTSISGS